MAGALAKAEHYRLLNEPAEAESICRDILEIEPGNQPALVCGILALSDQFPQDRNGFTRACQLVEQLHSPYDRAYYEGILWERRAKARHHEGGHGSRHTVYEWILKALEHFQTAELCRPPGNDNALLRWNTCVRFLERHTELSPRTEEAAGPILSE